MQHARGAVCEAAVSNSLCLPQKPLPPLRGDEVAEETQCANLDCFASLAMRKLQLPRSSSGAIARIKVAEPPWVGCPRNPLTPKRQVGAVYPGPQDEPVSQDRDSSLGLLIASGIFKRLVPGSPAASLFRRPVPSVLKHFRTFGFKHGSAQLSSEAAISPSFCAVVYHRQTACPRSVACFSMASSRNAFISLGPHRIELELKFVGCAFRFRFGCLLNWFLLTLLAGLLQFVGQQAAPRTAGSVQSEVLRLSPSFALQLAGR